MSHYRITETYRGFFLSCQNCAYGDFAPQVKTAIERWKLHRCGPSYLEPEDANGPAPLPPSLVPRRPQRRLEVIADDEDLTVQLPELRPLR